MKKRLLLSSVLLLAVTTLFNACKKDDEDTTAPVITLNGNAAETVSLNGTYSDAGATASDETDGTVTVTSSGTVDVNKTGTYTITYTATDAAGNTGTGTRTVTVKNDAAFLEGTYGVNENPGGAVWIQTITASTTKNNVITFSKFGNYSNNNTITAIVTGTTVKYVVLSPATQTVSGIGSLGCSHTFTSTGNGNPIAQVSGKYTFSVKFTDETLGTGGCTPVAATAYEDTFLQQ